MRSKVGLVISLSCMVLALAVRPGAQGQQAPPAGAPAQGQPPGGPGGQRGAPQPLVNIKVLPKTLTRQQVQALMQTFVTSLGQQAPAQGAPAAPAGQGEGCLHCHVTGPAPAGGGRATTAYDLDTNPNKDVARKMIQMVMAVNDGLKDVGDKAVAEKVSCFSCHRGDATAKPAMMPAAGWGRGAFSLLPAGPPTGPPRGGGH